MQRPRRGAQQKGIAVKSENETKPAPHSPKCGSIQCALCYDLDASGRVTRHSHGPAAACTPGCPGYKAMLAEKTAARLSATQVQNDRGGWVPAIPLPLFLSFGRCRCDCGETRRGQRSYREHYALTHVLGLS